MLEELKKRLSVVSETQINEMFSKGALKLTEAQIGTVSFVFWLVYMAEADLNTISKKAWEIAKDPASHEIEVVAEKMLQDRIGGQKIICPSCGTVCRNREIKPFEPEYFSDKIKVYEAFFGKTDRTNLLWKLNDIRNDLSHNRVDTLSYNGELLSERNTKEKLVLDYFRTSQDVDLSKSDIWNSLSEEEKETIRELYEKAEREGKTKLDV